MHVAGEVARVAQRFAFAGLRAPDEMERLIVALARCVAAGIISDRLARKCLDARCNRMIYHACKAVSHAS